MLARKLLFGLADIVRDSVTEFRNKRMYRDAAFLSYFAVLSLVPFVALLAWMAKLVADPLSVDPERMDQVRQTILGGTGNVFPFLAGELEGIVQEIMSYPSSAGILGLVAMFITAGLLFSALSVSISDIYSLDQPRGFWGARVVLLIALLGSGLVVFVLMLFKYLLSIAVEAGQFEGELPFWLMGLGAKLINGLLVVSGFLVTVRISTKGRLRNRPLLVGGLTFWLSWELAAVLFGYYVGNMPTISLIYGSLATIAILLLWLFYTANMFLWCVCLSARIVSGGKS